MKWFFQKKILLHLSTSSMIVEHGSGIWNQDQPLILISFFPYPTPSTLSLAINQQCQPYQWLMLSHLSSTYHHHLSISSNGIPPARCPSHKGCGPIYIMLNGQQHGGNKELREDVERRVGSRGKWCVTKKKPWWKSWIIFAFFIYLPSKSLTSPPEPNDTTKPWDAQNHNDTTCYLFHLPRIQTQARGGLFGSFNVSATTTTSLTSKRKPEVVLFGSFNAFATTTTSLTSKCEPEVVFAFVSIYLPWWPPPSCPNTNWRWLFWFFQHFCYDHHLPRIQTQAAGGSFWHFQHICHCHLPHVQKWARDSFFGNFDASATSSTSLAFKRELEVVLFGFSMCLWSPHQEKGVWSQRNLGISR